MTSFCRDELILYKDYVEYIEKELYSFLKRFDAPSGYYDYLLYHFGYKSLDENGNGNGSPRVLGKRLRPVMCLLICRALLGDFQRAAPLILSTEILHNASLIHDDIQDRDEVRWGRPALWKAFGLEQGINCGDTLQAMAYGSLLDLYDQGFSDAVVRKVFGISNRIHMTVVEGQYMDLLFERREEIAEYEYFEMISRKTAAPYAGIAECAAVLSMAEKNPDLAQYYRDFGLKFGMLFQLTDDILGIWGGVEKTGKIPADIRNRKKTLPIIYAFNNASAERKENLRAIYAGSSPIESDAAAVMEALEETGAYEASQKWAGKFYDETMSALSQTGIDDPFKDELKYMADYCFKRSRL